MVITIDGPVASGKSSVARMVAQRLGYTYLSSGLLYRALAYILVNEYGYCVKALSQGPKQEHVKAVFQTHELEYSYTVDYGGSITYKNQDITQFLKSAACDDWSSRISQFEIVRDYIMDFQRAFAHKENCIIEGRDCGSVVFPKALYKFFVTASLDERACRWQSMQKKRGDEFSLDYCRCYVQERDTRDITRDIAPLIEPDDAVVIDTTNMSLESVVKEIQSIVLGRSVD